MRKNVKSISHAALLAALYVALTYGQNLLIPNSTSWAIQFRASEALCIFAFFTPSAVTGLTIGCLLFNISNAGALPMDFLVGTLATFFSVGGMYLTRKLTVKGYPLLGMLLPGLFNALFIGWELSVYIGNSILINGLYVAIGELAVMFTLGTLLFYAIKSRGLDTRLF